MACEGRCNANLQNIQQENNHDPQYPTSSTPNKKTKRNQENAKKEGMQEKRNQ